MNSLFSSNVDPEMLPLAERIRPQNLAEIFGQKHFLSEKSAIFKLLKNNHLLNLIFWGPPGTGKTTLAMSLAQTTKAHWIQLNAVDAGVKDLKSACEIGQNLKYEQLKKTLLFVDEIHRFNKTQQDVLLPYIERGDIYLIGATTEFPSYELNKALLSRCQVVEFKKLSQPELLQILERASYKLNLSVEQILQTEACDGLLQYADGDSRKLLNVLDLIFKLFQSDIEKAHFPLDLISLEEFLGKKIISYDKKSEQHYDCISAFIKSMRGSDPDAALYYCARMLEGGEDPVFIARRMIVFSSEDIGNADPRALPLAVACLQAIEAIGMPEARINIGQTVIFLASAPKSNSSYMAINKAIEFVKKTGAAEIPKILQSSQKGQGYKYPHDFDRGFVKQNHWPEKFDPPQFFEPKILGAEKNLNEYLKWIRNENE